MIDFLNFWKLALLKKCEEINKERWELPPFFPV
jgi:hypothetical protein